MLDFGDLYTKQQSPIEQETTTIISHRMENRIPRKFFYKVLNQLDITTYVIAGNACNEEVPNDLDIYFLEEPQDKITKIIAYLGENFSTIEIYKSKNAISFEFDGIKIQICSYTASSLRELIESFDFSHVQVGVKVRGESIDEVYFTDAWILSRVSRSTKYTGSAYPLSSLIRARKYAERGWLSSSGYRATVCKILASIISRGYKDYKDFKDQLAAVDMLDLDEKELSAAQTLYNACVKRKLVEQDNRNDEEEEEE